VTKRKGREERRDEFNRVVGNLRLEVFGSETKFLKSRVWWQWEWRDDVWLDGLTA